eukprot:7672178-Pyramimonas_sp.AAC.1
MAILAPHLARGLLLGFQRADLIHLCLRESGHRLPLTRLRRRPGASPTPQPGRLVLGALEASSRFARVPPSSSSMGFYSSSMGSRCLISCLRRRMPSSAHDSSHLVRRSFAVLALRPQRGP